ncbi:MAG: DUF2752 domain-containing protein [Bryobacteraceae bacterium]
MTELRRALLLVWLVASGALLPVVSGPWLFSATALRSAATRCRLEHAGGKPCPLCGMTQAFIHIGRREWSAARRANPAALPLYFSLVINELTAVVVIFDRSGRNRAYNWGGHCHENPARADCVRRLVRGRKSPAGRRGS